MANDALRLWQEVIKELRSISKCLSERAPNQTKVLTTLLQQLNSTSSLPRATWKTLITEKKVRWAVPHSLTGRQVLVDA
jgi:hypothetical protein